MFDAFVCEIEAMRVQCYVPVILVCEKDLKSIVCA